MQAHAPWADPVLMTAEELSRLPEDGWSYELVDGRLVRLSLTGRNHGKVVMALLLAVGRFVEARHLGEVLPPETGFLVSSAGEADTVLAPDLAFVTSAREQNAATEGYPRLAPDLVAEVASPSQGHAKMRAKADLWLSSGVRLVWLVFPETRTVEVWRERSMISVATREQELAGEDILPEFVLPLTRLFP